MRINKKVHRKGGAVFFGGLLFVACLCILWGLAGCAASPKASGIQAEDSVRFVTKSEVEAPSAPAGDRMEEGAANSWTLTGGNGKAYAAAGETASGEVRQRYIIQNAILFLEIRDIEETAAALQHLAEESGGYVASREIYNIKEERRAGNVSLRVPAARFSVLIAAIKELGVVKNDHVYTDDVTMEYIDLEARITNLAAQERRLREILEKAANVEEIMQVEKELGRVRGDLESMEGSFRYLRERVNYSTIDIQLEERDMHTLLTNDKFSGFGGRLASLLALNTNRFLAGLSGFIIVAIGSLPILVPLLLIAFLVWKVAVLIRAKNKGKLKQPAHTERMNRQS